MGINWDSLGKQEWWVYVLAVLGIILVFALLNMIVRRINEKLSLIPNDLNEKNLIIISNHVISERRLIAISTATTHGTVRSVRSDFPNRERVAPIPAELKPAELITTVDISTKIETPDIYKNQIEKPIDFEKLTSCENKITSAITTACCVPTASFEESGGQRQKIFLGLIYTEPNTNQNIENNNENITTTEEIVLKDSVEIRQKEESEISKGQFGQLSPDFLKPGPASNDRKPSVQPVKTIVITDMVNETNAIDDLIEYSTDTLQNETETSLSNTDTILSKVNDIVRSPNTSAENNVIDCKKPGSPLPNYENVINCILSKTDKTAADLPILRCRSGVIIRRKSYIGGPSDANLRNDFTIRSSSDPLMKEELMRRKQWHPTPNKNSSFEVTDDDAYPKITCSRGFTNIQSEDNVRDWIEIMIVDRIMSFEPSTEINESKYFV